MYNFFRQNKNILLVSVGVFLASMTMLLIFLNNADSKGGEELQTDVIHSESPKQEDEETRYRRILGNDEDPVLVLSLDGKIRFSSKDSETVTGFSENDLENTLLSSYLHPDDLSIFFAAFGKAIATGKPVMMVGPVRIRNGSGEYIYAMASVYPVVEEERVTGVGITVKDISDNLDQYIDAEVEEQVQAPVEPEEQSAASGIRPATPRSDNRKVAPEKETPAPEEPAKWLKPAKIKSDPSWITGGKIVMMLPFSLPIFPAHLPLAQL